MKQKDLPRGICLYTKVRRQGNSVRSYRCYRVRMQRQKKQFSGGDWKTLDQALVALSELKADLDRIFNR